MIKWARRRHAPVQLARRRQNSLIMPHFCGLDPISLGLLSHNYIQYRDIHEPPASICVVVFQLSAGIKLDVVTNTKTGYEWHIRTVWLPQLTYTVPFLSYYCGSFSFRPSTFRAPKFRSCNKNVEFSLKLVLKTSQILNYVGAVSIV